MTSGKFQRNSFKVAFKLTATGTRERGGGSGGNLPPLEDVGAPPLNFGLSMSFIFLRFFLHVEFGLSQEIVGKIRGIFSFG